MLKDLLKKNKVFAYVCKPLVSACHMMSLGIKFIKPNSCNKVIIKASPDYKSNSKVRNHLHNPYLAFLGIVTTVLNASSHTSFSLGILLPRVFKDEQCPLKEKWFNTLSLAVSGFHLLHIHKTFHGKQVYSLLYMAFSLVLITAV